jgi:hypothetical protein
MCMCVCSPGKVGGNPHGRDPPPSSPALPLPPSPPQDYGGVEAVCGLPPGTQLRVLPDSPSMLLRWLLTHGPLRGLLLAGEGGDKGSAIRTV